MIKTFISNMGMVLYVLDVFVYLSIFNYLLNQFRAIFQLKSPCFYMNKKDIVWEMITIASCRRYK